MLAQLLDVICYNIDVSSFAHGSVVRFLRRFLKVKARLGSTFDVLKFGLRGRFSKQSWALAVFFLIFKIFVFFKFYIHIDFFKNKVPIFFGFFKFYIYIDFLKKKAPFLTTPFHVTYFCTPVPFKKPTPSQINLIENAKCKKNRFS